MEPRRSTVEAINPLAAAEEEGMVPANTFATASTQPSGKANASATAHAQDAARKLLTRADVRQDHHAEGEMGCRERIVFESEKLWWGVVVVLLVLVDFAVWVADVARDGENIDGVLLSTHVSLVVTCILCVEWLVRLAAHGPARLLGCAVSKAHSALAWIDFFASFGSLAVVVFTLSYIDQTGNLHHDSRYATVIGLARLARVARLCLIVSTQRTHVINATRRLVSQNRRRFQDDEFDLDLTYVTDEIIAMSLPAHKKKDVLYRNNIDDVARFFQARHRVRSIWLLSFTPLHRALMEPPRPPVHAHSIHTIFFFPEPLSCLQRDVRAPVRPVQIRWRSCNDAGHR